MARRRIARAPEIEPLAYSIEELRHVLGIGLSSARRFAREHGVRLGRRVLVPRAAIDQLLATGGQR